MGSKDFAYTGGWAKWVVPKGVAYVTVTLNGAGSSGRKGGRVTGEIKVKGGQALFVGVGGAGKANSGGTGGAAAFGGGGKGGTGHGQNGGHGGGGATVIRMTSSSGTVKAIAAGAGGSAGDGGLGGLGGAASGQNGAPGPASLGSVGNATGGTQVQGGNGGTSSQGSLYGGANATDGTLGTGGAGGSVDLVGVFGGGGGGGGLRAGGGGQAGLLGVVPAGGGGGGSNYTGGLISYSTTQGAGASGNGSVSLSWTNPPPANQPPSPPTDVFVNGVAKEDAQVTKSTGPVTISARIDDPSAQQTVRLEIRFSSQSSFTSGVATKVSTYVKQGKRATVHLTGLSQDTHYYARLYTRDSKGRLSTNYTAANFWTNRPPTEPTLVAPTDGSMVTSLESVVFQWTHIDPDATDSTPSPQRAYRLRWRQAPTPTADGGAWTQTQVTSAFNQYTANPGTFKSNVFYEWTVQTQDQEGAWGPLAPTLQFLVTGTSTSPTLVAPVLAVAVDVSTVTTFEWTFRDPDQGDSQRKADLQYRPLGVSDEWFFIAGDLTTPGGNQTWTLPTETFEAGLQYEWQVRTYDTLTAEVSDWSESQTFWTIRTPGTAVLDTTFPEYTTPQETLGCGSHRVFVYARGGQHLIGEVKPLQSLNYDRKRDDISDCTIVTNGFDEDCGVLLGQLRSWMHELVIFRDGVRVWEGPITLITYAQDSVTIQAKDVMAWVYRRILRQGYDDSYRLVNGQQLGQRSVVERAMLITMNALAPDDPNILPYLTPIMFADDAGQSRVVPPFSRTAWEEVDDLAATAGLDYTTIGRRILFWDTHRPVGRLAEMRDVNFSDPPVVSEYGMQTATVFAVTNNNGIFGLVQSSFAEYGLVEMLASAYGETDAAATDVLTSAARASLENTLSDQASRSMGDRYPTPLVVRVPDNSTLNPETNVSINQLVPGVWIPLRAMGIVRTVTQWQKLDLVTVTQTAAGESIQVTMSPAPNAGEDPDANTDTEDEGDI